MSLRQIHSTIILLSILSQSLPVLATPVKIIESGSEVGTANVRVDTKMEGDAEVTVARVTGKILGSMFGTSSSGTTHGSLYGEAYEDLCVTPCQFEIPAGNYEFKFYNGNSPVTNKRLKLTPGNHELEVRPGSVEQFWVGWAAMGFGIGFLALGLATLNTEEENYIFDMSPVTHLVLGSGLTIGGLVLYLSSHPSVDHQTKPASSDVASSLSRSTPMVGWAGQF